MMILQVIFIVLSALLSQALALSSSDIASVFGAVNTGLTGTSTKTDAFELTAIANSTHALISLNATSSGSIGWWGVGFGTEMADADLLVLYPLNSAWTLSHRTATGHRAPSIQTGASAFFTLVPSLSTTSSVSFLRPLKLASEPGYVTASSFTSLSASSGQQFVWAAGSKNPGSADESAPISFHDIGQGSLRLDLSKALSSSTSTGGNGNANGGSSPVASQSGSAPWTKRDKILVAHAVFGMMAWMVLAPLGALIGRWARSKKGWVQWHQGVQIVGTGGCTLIAVALGMAAVQTGGGDHWVGSHKALGLALAILMIIQVTLGEVNHFLYQKWVEKNAGLTLAAIRTRPWNNYLHIFLGVLLVILGYIQVHLGLNLYARTPSFLRILFYILLSLQIVLYLLGSIRSFQSRRKSADARSLSSTGSDAEKFAGVQPSALTTPGGSQVDLPKLPQSQPMTSLASLHDQAQVDALRGMGSMGPLQMPAGRDTRGPYASYSNEERNPSRIQSTRTLYHGQGQGHGQGEMEAQRGTMPQPRDYARPPYVGGAYDPSLHQHQQLHQQEQLRQNVNNGPSYSYSNATSRVPLQRGPSRNGVGQTGHTDPIGGRNMPTFVHHQQRPSASSTSSDPRMGMGGEYKGETRIELAGDWRKKGTGYGHARQGSLKRRSISMSSSAGTSSAGHGI